LKVTEARVLWAPRRTGTRGARRVLADGLFEIVPNGDVPISKRGR
jgi:hypothetical protein